MYHIVICDDEKEIVEKIAESVKNGLLASRIDVRYTFLSDSRELVRLMEEQAIDILFLDIDMPYFGGMDIAGMITDKGLDTILVFVTGYDALVYRTFEYRPFAFIRKSYFKEEIDGVLGRILKELLLRRRDFIIKRGQEVVKIPLADILYVESAGNYINIFTVNGFEKCRDTLLNIQKELSGREFIRCHKGYLVNSKHIIKLNSTEIVLTGGVSIPVGRSYEKEFRQKVLASMRN